MEETGNWIMVPVSELGVRKYYNHYVQITEKVDQGAEEMQLFLILSAQLILLLQRKIFICICRQASYVCVKL